LELRTGFRSPASEKGQAALAEIRQLVSHVRLLAVAGYISSHNVAAVAEALDELGMLIVASQRSALSEQFTISSEDLIPPTSEAAFPAHPERDRAARTYREKAQGTAQTPGASGSVRVEQIMDILKLGGVLGIKDIAANVPQYSEKMVQRTLVDLVQTGRIKKIGAKRWSKYQVAQ